MKQNAVGCNSNTRIQGRNLLNNGFKIGSYQRFATCNSDFIDIKLLNENYGTMLLHYQSAEKIDVQRLFTRTIRQYLEEIAKI